MFSLFSGAHFVYIFIAAALVAGMTYVLKKFQSNKEQNTALGILLGAMVFFVILELVGRVITIEPFKLFNHLPLNSFQVFVWISIFAYFSRRLSWIKFGYLVIAPVSAISIIFVPTLYTTMGSFSLSLVSFMIINILLIVYSIVSLVYTQYDLEHKDVYNSVINLIIIIAIGHIVNVILRFTAWGLQADYFGTMAEGYNSYITLISKLIPIPFVVMLPLFAAMFGIAYLVKIPFDVIKTRKEKQEQLEEIIALGNLKEQQKFREEERANKKAKSQVLVRPDVKATPNATKNPNNSSSKSGFLNTQKEVKVDNTRRPQ